MCVRFSLAVPSPTYIQGNSADPAGPQSQLSATYTGAQLQGDLNVSSIGWQGDNVSVNSVTDASGNTYNFGAVISDVNAIEASMSCSISEVSPGVWTLTCPEGSLYQTNGAGGLQMTIFEDAQQANAQALQADYGTLVPVTAQCATVPARRSISYTCSKLALMDIQPNRRLRFLAHLLHTATGIRSAARYP